MNVYNRATGWGAFATIALLAAVLALDVWLMHKLPFLQRGLGYAMLQVVMVGLLLKAIWLIFKGGRPSAKD